MKSKTWTACGFPSRAAAAILTAHCCTMLPMAAQEETTATGADAASLAQAEISAAGQAVFDERRAITSEIEALETSGAFPERIAAWREKNAARLANNLRQLMEISENRASIPKPYISEVMIPGDASETMEAFLVDRATLANGQIQIRNAMPHASPEERAKAVKADMERNAGALDDLVEKAVRISNESRSASPPLPAPRDIPADASPALRDFLILQNARLRTETDASARLQNATAEQQPQILAEWQAADSEAAAALREAAVRLSNESKK